MRVIPDNKVCPFIYELTRCADAPLLRRVYTLCASVVVDDLKVGLYFSLFDAWNDIVRLPLTPQPMTNKRNRVSVLFKIHCRVVVPEKDARIQTRFNGVPCPFVSVVACVVVGKVSNFNGT